MAKVSYEQAYQDHSYLWDTYGPAAYMTGAYVDQEDLAKLLKSPTKKTASDCLCRQIAYWFYVGTDDEQKPELIEATDPMVRDIRERHSL